jgi:hypothetical protein
MLKTDEYFPLYDFSESHKILIKCSPQKAYETLITLNFSESIFIRCLFWLRGLNSRNLQHLRERFTLLYNEPSKEIILGLIARPWKLSGGRLHLSKEDFQSFSEPDYAKIVWNFTFEHQNENETLVSTETRILCTDIKSRKKFRKYWFFIRPFSGLIRIEILRILRKKLEG